MLLFSPHSRSSKASLRGLSAGRRGFTLLELLVVMAIIGVLAAIVFTSMLQVRQKSRDMKRLKDIETIQGAVEQYYRDHGHYPITNCTSATYASFDSSDYKGNKICSTSGGTGVNTISQELATFMPNPPKDPSVVKANDAGYLYRSDTGANYCILIWRTPENMSNFKTNNIEMGRCGTINSKGVCTSAGGNNIYFNSAPGATGC